eukprot:96018-Amorphochlora_amoeboformis.AAC.1
MNVIPSRTLSNLRESSASVIWRDVTLCHGIGSPVLPGTTQNYRQGNLPGSQEISEISIITLSHITDTYVYAKSKCALTTMH